MEPVKCSFPRFLQTEDMAISILYQAAYYLGREPTQKHFIRQLINAFFRVLDEIISTSNSNHQVD